MLSIKPTSTLSKELHNKGIQELIEKRLSKNKLKALEAEEKRLEEHFKNSKDLKERNFAILRALDDGYTQEEVARYLGLSSAMVSKIFRGIRKRVVTWHYNF